MYYNMYNIIYNVIYAAAKTHSVVVVVVVDVGCVDLETCRMF